MIRFCLVVVGLTVLCSCVSPEASGDMDVAPGVVESAQRYRKEYILAAGDVIDVVVGRTPEVSRTCMIRPDGYISLPILDDVKAAGRTVSELDAALTELLSKRLVEPEVAVIATVVRQPMVYVYGEVGAPQPVALRDATTAAQAIAHAGGLTYSSARNSVAIIRLTEEGRLRAYTITTDVHGQPAPYMALQAMLLQPDDLIVVPESDRSQMVRFIEDYINTPLGGINSLLTPYFQFRLIEEVSNR